MCFLRQYWTKDCKQIPKNKCKLGSSVECFTADFSRFWWLLGGWMGARNEIQAFQRISENFLIS